MQTVISVMMAAAPFLVPAVVLAAGQAAPKRDDPTTWKWSDSKVPTFPGLEHRTLKSRAVNQDVGYNVVLPDEYRGRKERFPVVYFLHGAGGTENSDAAGFAELVRRQVLAGRMSPVICVFPNGALSGYRDLPNGPRAETMILEELVPEVDRRYRTKADRSGRVLAGFSMGGGGSVRLLLRHPDVFCGAASWAGSLRDFGGESPAGLAEQNRSRLSGRARFLLVVGDQDQTFAPHAQFVKTLRELKLDVEYRVLPGVGHDLGRYYEQTGDELVAFLARTLGVRKEN